MIMKKIGSNMQYTILEQLEGKRNLQELTMLNMNIEKSKLTTVVRIFRLRLSIYFYVYGKSHEKVLKVGKYKMC